MKKIIACAFAGLLSFAACETTMGMNVTAMLQQRNPKNGNTALHAAVKKGNISIVQLLLPHCTANDINAVNNDGWAALNFAAENGEPNMFNLLLLHPGINVNIADNNGETPLYVAIEKWNNNIASVLISTPGIDVNALTTVGRSPLSLAAEKGNTEIVRLLLSNPNINPDIAGGFSHSALHYAIDKANPDKEDIKTALLLINDGRVDVNSGPNPLSTAISHQNMTIIKALLVRSDFSLSGEYSATIIPSALSSGNSEILEILLSDPKYDGHARVVAINSIFSQYIDNWDEKLVLMVLKDHRINPNGTSTSENWCPPLIHFALEYNNNLKLFKLILQNLKIDLNKKFFPAMMGYEAEKMFDKIEHVSPFKFLINKFNSTKEFEIKNSIEYLSKLFLFRKMAPAAMLSQDALQQWASREYPELVESELWNYIVGIVYGDKPELLMFSLLISNDDRFNVSNEMGIFRFNLLKNLFERLVFFKEFAPEQVDLQQWVNEEYPQFAASEAWQQVLEILYGSKKD